MLLSRARCSRFSATASATLLLALVIFLHTPFVSAYEACSYLGNRGHRTLTCDSNVTNPVRCDPCFEECYQVVPATNYSVQQWGCRCINSGSTLNISSCPAATPYCQVGRAKNRICSASRCATDNDCDDSCRKTCDVATGHCVARNQIIACPDTNGSNRLRLIMPSSCHNTTCRLDEIVLKNYKIGLPVEVYTTDIPLVSDYVIGTFQTNYMGFENEQPLALMYYTGPVDIVTTDVTICIPLSVGNAATCGYLGLCPDPVLVFTDSNSRCWSEFRSVLQRLGSSVGVVWNCIGASIANNVCPAQHQGFTAKVLGRAPRWNSVWGVYSPTPYQQVKYFFDTTTQTVANRQPILIKSQIITTTVSQISGFSETLCANNALGPDFCISSVNTSREYSRPLIRRSTTSVFRLPGTTVVPDIVVIKYAINNNSSLTVRDYSTVATGMFANAGLPSVSGTYGYAQSNSIINWVYSYPNKTWTGNAFWSGKSVTSDYDGAFNLFFTQCPQGGCNLDSYYRTSEDELAGLLVAFGESFRPFPQIRGRCADDFGCSVASKQWTMDLQSSYPRLVTTNASQTLDSRSSMILTNKIILNTTIIDIPDYAPDAFSPSILSGETQLQSAGFIAGVTVSAVVISVVIIAGTIWLVIYFKKRNGSYDKVVQ